MEVVTDVDLERVVGGEDALESAPPASSSSGTNWRECAEDVGKLAAGSALVLGSKMPTSTKVLGAGLLGFHGGREIGASCPGVVQRVFGVGPKKLFAEGSFR